MGDSDDRERAARGAKLLDEKLPRWSDKIDREKLSMKCGLSCILGQCYAGYEAGLYELGFDNNRSEDGDAVQNGFVLNDVTEREDHEWSKLKEIWISLIEERQAV